MRVEKRGGGVGRNDSGKQQRRTRWEARSKSLTEEGNNAKGEMEEWVREGKRKKDEEREGKRRMGRKKDTRDGDKRRMMEQRGDEKCRREEWIVGRIEGVGKDCGREREVRTKRKMKQCKEDQG